MGRGGLRVGAGRRSALTFNQQILLGSMCEQYQESFRLNEAKSEYDAIPAVKALREAHALLPGRDPKAQARIIASEVRPLIRSLKGVSVRIGRGKTRAQIIARVSDLARNRMGLALATPRRVEACWKIYRRFLISARVSSGREG